MGRALRVDAEAAPIPCRVDSVHNDDGAHPSSIFRGWLRASESLSTRLFRSLYHEVRVELRASTSACASDAALDRSVTRRFVRAFAPKLAIALYGTLPYTA